MKLPNNPKHRPIIVVDNYDQIDGKYQGRDAKFLSIGYAQYNMSDLSLKVFRKPKDRWSPQSEELPLHRVLDLSILLLRTLATDSDVLIQSPLSERMKEVNYYNLGKTDIVNFCREDRSHLLPRLEELKYLLNTIDFKMVI